LTSGARATTVPNTTHSTQFMRMSPSPKVLLLVENNGFPRDFRLRREAHALRDHGFDVSVICPREEQQPWRERLDGVEVYRFPEPPGGSGAFSYALEFCYSTIAMLAIALWVWLRRGVDVVHSANPPDTLFVVGAVFRLLGKRYIFDHHDLSPEVYLSRFGHRKHNLIYRALKLLERCSYGTANVVIATNDSYRRRAIEEGAMDPDKVFVVRNGPPLAYQPLPPPESLAGKAAHLIGYIGTIGPQDGLDYWMRAIHCLANELGRTDFLAIVIGDGDAMPDVQRLAAELKIESLVYFTGRLSEVESRRHLSATTLCVQPDPPGPLNDHSTMNKLMEYMALGKPSVAFDLPETRVSGGAAVSYVSETLALEFAKEVHRLLDSPEERQRMAAVGKQRVQQQLAWEHSVPSLIAAYCGGLALKLPTALVAKANE
jgi:glycosyltransferase involved in cell wall biosynthesis